MSMNSSFSRRLHDGEWDRPYSDVRLTTQTYVHVQAEALRRAVCVLDRIELNGEEGTRTSHHQTTAS